MPKYDFNNIEKKWRQRWEETPVQQNTASKPKYYCLDMFPYPSGSALHVGHWRGYVLSDVLSRHKILQGYHVLHPMGWDAFGLAAENNAIKQKKHPSVSVAENIKTMKKQLIDMSTIYDWKDEINTTDPAYYKWTQWIFARMFEKGLAYEQEMPLNWCPTCKVVLANEEAVGGVCERCHNPATKKNLRQWMLKITAYGERLLNDLQGLQWPEKVKKMQSDWIGKSHGAEIDFNGITAFTTRPDTLCGATFMVLAPEHPLVEKLTTPECKAAVEAYVQRAAARSAVDRMQDKEKTGVFIGHYVENPLNREKMPVWVADYVLADYGTGAIMCVPGHDERDFEFATKFNLPIKQVIAPNGEIFDEFTQAYTGDGLLVNSGEFNGLSVEAAKKAVNDFLEKTGRGKATINYKLRDWVFSRQRYWGEPIPIVHCDTCGPVVVPDEQLPVLLPDVASYEPTDTGESPLAAIADWVNTPCPKCNAPAKRETNTMPQWAGSSWYFLRYPDIDNDNFLAGTQALNDWLPVDYYVGGIEHAVLHLLYARFYTKFLYDIGVVKFEEPFTTLFNIGMINYKGKKMSKGEGYGVSPDDILPKYGCDALRLYEMFIAPPEMDCEWDDSGIEGVSRFLNKLWRLVDSAKFVSPTEAHIRHRHKLIHDITTRLENLSLNTVVSGFMEHVNHLQSTAAEGLCKETLETIAILLSPFAPHIAEEIWETLGHSESVFTQKWPCYDPAMLKTDTQELAMQINGKLRGNLTVQTNAAKEDVLKQAREALADKLANANIVKEIYVPGRIVNFVVKV
ncbi:MAG: leucine--tRNA ligase [Defluviitaleaceae bacterium]|nr:leucine--tRNA ligase [Defluviitaleaceae bacterium]MCL2274689.1 leucine--tRNA ligase [Defluviitaleaceae bacterium]